MLNIIANMLAGVVLICLFIDHSAFNPSTKPAPDPLISIVVLLGALVLKTNNKEKT